MQIKFAKIHKFNPFKLAKVNRLSLTATSPIQILVGDNGSGKTSLLNELHPMAAVSSSYGKGGSKHLVIEHEGSTYDLISDFTKSGHAHSFIKDGVDLNTSGTSGIQNELVQHHLGYDTTTHKLLHMSQKMCSMGKAERRQFLLTLNPIDLTIVLDKYKLIVSRIKECKNNLTLLNGKIQEIKSKLLADNIRESLEEQRKTKNVELTNYTSELFYLNNLRGQILTEIAELPSIPNDITAASIVKSCKTTLTKMLVGLHEVPRNWELSQYKEDVVRNKIIVDSAKEKLDERYRDLGRLQQDIELYMNHLQTAESGETIELLENELKLIDMKSSEILQKLDLRYPRIPLDEVTVHTVQYNYTIERINRYTEFRLKSKVTATLVKKFADKVDLFIRKSTYLKSTIASEISILEESEKELMALKMDVPCQYEETSCDLLKHYKEKIKDLTSKKEAARVYISELQRKERIASRGFEKLNENYLKYKDALDCIYEIQYALQNTKSNKKLEDLQEVLYRNPNQLIVELTQTLAMASLYDQQEELEHRKQTILDKLKKMQESGAASIDFIHSLLNRTKQKFSDLQTDIRTDETYLKERTKHLTNTERFVYVKSKIEEYQERLSQIINRDISKMNLEFCDLQISAVKTRIDELNTQLREIDNSLKDQTGLIARLKDAEDTASTITTRKIELEHVARSISPYTGFPHRHMIDFANSLIHNVNCVLAQVWSYPFSVIPLTYTDTFDGTFKVQVDDVVVPDLESLSKAQEAMMNLAWTLAFVLCKNLTDYPIYLDECDEGFDHAHKGALLDWLRSLIDQRLVSQLWMVHHEAVLYDGFADGEVLCLSDNNIVRPEKMNRHVDIS